MSRQPSQGTRNAARPLAATAPTDMPAVIAALAEPRRSSGNQSRQARVRHGTSPACAPPKIKSRPPEAREANRRRRPEGAERPGDSVNRQHCPPPEAISQPTAGQLKRDIAERPDPVHRPHFQVREAELILDHRTRRRTGPCGTDKRSRPSPSSRPAQGGVPWWDGSGVEAAVAVVQAHAGSQPASSSGAVAREEKGNEVYEEPASPDATTRPVPGECHEDSLLIPIPADKLDKHKPINLIQARRLVRANSSPDIDTPSSPLFSAHRWDLIGTECRPPVNKLNGTSRSPVPSGDLTADAWCSRFFGELGMNHPEREIVRIGVAGARILGVARESIDYIDGACQKQFIDLEECSKNWGRWCVTIGATSSFRCPAQPSKALLPGTCAVSASAARLTTLLGPSS